MQTTHTECIYRLAAAAVAVVLITSASAWAEWTQFGGPNRDFKSPATGLSTEWPEGGPKRLWSRALDGAYSGVAATSDTLFTMSRSGDEDIVVALAADSGATKWEHRYSAPAFPGLDQSFGMAPRSTPLVLPDRVITAGITGRLHCLDRETGKVHWSHDLMAEYGATRPRWGYSSSPLAYKNTVIVPAGGKGHGVMAFDRNSGAVVWSKHDFANAYSSPMLIDVDGQEQLVVFMAPGVAGLDPATGELLWQHPHRTDYDVNASLPVWGEDNLLFISSDYGTGSRGLRLTRSGDRTNVEEVWQQKKMRVHFGNAIRIDDLIYGSTGGNGPVFFAAVNAKTGEFAFQHRDLFAKAQLVHADGKLIILDEDGQLCIGTPTAEGVTIHARAQLLDKVAWTAPTLVGTRLYIRDNKTIMALDLG